MIRNVQWCDISVCLADTVTKFSAPLVDTFLDVAMTKIMIDLKIKKSSGRKQLSTYFSYFKFTK